ncbi:MAG: FtsX-like permease family protein, partial [Phycicoccus sp.]
ATALDRRQLAAPYVVDTAGDARVVDRLSTAGLPLLDQRLTVQVDIDDADEHVEVVDVAAAARARRLSAVEGDLSGLASGGIAVTESWNSDRGKEVGDVVTVDLDGRTLRPRIVAVVHDAPNLHGDLLLGRPSVEQALRGAVPDLVFVDPGARDLSALLTGTTARIATADQWIDDVDAQTRSGNEAALWVLLGPAGLYAAIAIANAILIGAFQKRDQLRTIALLGATRGQLRRMALWEAGLIGAAALLAGAATTGLTGWLVREATTRDVPGHPLTLPWLPLTGIAMTCTCLALVAALVGARGGARPAKPT